MGKGSEDTNHAERYHLPWPSVSVVPFIKGHHPFWRGPRK